MLDPTGSFSHPPIHITFPEFRQQAKAAGLDARDHGFGKWTVEGGPMHVTYWPRFPGGPLVFIQGTVGPWFTLNPEQAIAQATTLPPTAHKDLRVKWKGEDPGRWRYRIQLRRVTRWCAWCGCYLSQKESTIDHVIPRSRGGSNDLSNLRLSCYDCNYGRGDIMPEVFGQGPAEAMPA